MDKRHGNPGRPVLNRKCEFAGCTDKHYAGGLCRRHYNQKRNGSELTLRYESDICIVPGCKNLRAAKGLCNKHYARLRKYNSPDVKYVAGRKSQGGHQQYPDHSGFKKNRKIVLKKYKLCRCCGKRKIEMVHHNDFTKTNHNVDNLVPLCWSCHKKIHKFLDKNFTFLDLKSMNCKIKL